jgi:hypothetical protein
MALNAQRFCSMQHNVPVPSPPADMPIVHLHSCNSTNTLLHANFTFTRLMQKLTIYRPLYNSSHLDPGHYPTAQATKSGNSHPISSDPSLHFPHIHVNVLQMTSPCSVYLTQCSTVLLEQSVVPQATHPQILCNHKIQCPYLQQPTLIN